MTSIATVFHIPPEIAEGLKNGVYERVGGVIRDTQTKQVVGWLREAPGFPGVASSAGNLLPGINLAFSALNLTVSAAGFAMVLRQLENIEQRLKQLEKVLQDVSEKLDLSFYAKFHAALDLAQNMLTMSNRGTRKAVSIEAVARFAEARYIYTSLAEKHLASGSSAADEYIATLALAYVAEARCYLELEELSTAHRILVQGAVFIETYTRRQIEILLTSNPAAYLHPSLKGSINLRRLTRVYQWLDPTLDENAVFESQRENFIQLVREPRAWIDSLPPAIWSPKLDREKKIVYLPFGRTVELGETVLGPLIPGGDEEQQIYQRLPIAMNTIEAMIEDAQRFQAYALETSVIQQLGVSFEEWSRLAPKESAVDNAGLMWLTFSEPLRISV